jgi:hypothetical protein
LRGSRNGISAKSGGRTNQTCKPIFSYWETKFLRYNTKGYPNQGFSQTKYSKINPLDSQPNTEYKNGANFAGYPATKNTPLIISANYRNGLGIDAKTLNQSDSSVTFFSAKMRQTADQNPNPDANQNNYGCYVSPIGKPGEKLNYQFISPDSRDPMNKMYKTYQDNLLMQQENKSEGQMNIAKGVSVTAYSGMGHPAQGIRDSYPVERIPVHMASTASGLTQ